MREIFNPQNPNVRTLKGGDYELTDLSQETVSQEEILEFIRNLGHRSSLILPRKFNPLNFQPTSVSAIYQAKYPYGVFNRYGPHIPLNTTKMTIEEAQKKVFDLKRAMKEVKGDYQRSFRGFGVISPRTNSLLLLPFLDLIEGYELGRMIPEHIRITSRPKRGYEMGWDCTGIVPSVSREDKEHLVTITDLPVISQDKEYALWMQMATNCNCEWAHYFSKRGERRYVSGEHFIGHHGIALYRKILMDYPNRFLDLFPEPTGIVAPWENLLKRVAIYDHNRGYNRKLWKTELNAMLGMLTFYMGTENAFDLN
jgi:hypothetical protein